MSPNQKLQVVTEPEPDAGCKICGGSGEVSYKVVDEGEVIDTCRCSTTQHRDPTEAEVLEWVLAQRSKKVRNWSTLQIRTFAIEIKSNLGGGWRLLVPEIQHAIVAAKVLSIIRSQASETVRVSDIDELSKLLHKKMGTE